MNDVLLDVRHVNKTFPVKGGLFSESKKVVCAVNDVSFQVLRGETFGLVGESGCGKSTLSRTLLRLVQSDSGEIIFEDKDLVSIGKKELQSLRKEMRIVFQKPFSSLNPRQTVMEIIGAPIRVHEKGLSSNEIKKQVMELMDQVGLPAAYINRHPHEFSGGQRQRIGIARAIALNPKLIICDEPVSALDVSIQSQILNLLKDLQEKRNLTYIFISHNLSVVKHMSDCIAVMYLGCIVEIANATDLYGKAMHPYTQALLSAIPDTDIENKRERIILTGDIPSPVDPPKGCLFRTRCLKAVKRCEDECPRLRDTGGGHSVACFLCENGGEPV